MRRRRSGRQPIDPAFVSALAKMRRRLSYAEAWRALRPVSEKLGVPRPSYHLVREIMIELGRSAQKQAEAADAVAAKVISGRVVSPDDVILVKEAVRARRTARRRAA